MLGVEPKPDAWTRLARGTLAPGTRFGETSQLFPRIDQSVEELRQMADSTSNQPPSTDAGEAAQHRRGEATQHPTGAAIEHPTGAASEHHLD